MENFGWLKDKFDKRDYLFRATLKEIPPVLLLTDYLPTVRNQGNVGSCVGFGIGANLVARAIRLADYTEWFSPAWIYNGARFIEGTLSQDVGCYPRDALHWLYEKGCLLEHFWPYNPKKLDTTPPPSHLEPEAAKRPLLSYYRVVDGVTGICEVIANEQYVSIGTPWFEKWRRPKNGVLEEVGVMDPVAGGHETCLYGYDKDKRIFYGINSWGEGWGNKGHYTMPFSAFDVFKYRGGYDAHYIGLSPAPEPEEESTCPIAQGIVLICNGIAELFGRETRIPRPVKLRA